ncbi:MAG TPA: lipopolysaccharide heptosyltransferase II [Pirellulales bacterium]|nr:lipopolysaccharide heptosyltransferase II [Pirellulales bacterium]
MTKIAVFLPNWVGDVVMATPMLRALREHVGEQGRILGVMRPHVAEVLAGTTWLDEQLLYDPRSPDLRERGWALVRRLRRERADLAVLLPNSWRTALLAWAGGAKDRLGYARGGRGLLLTRTLHPPKADGRRLPVSAVDYFLDLAYAAGCEVAAREVQLATLPADERAADAVWRKFRLPPGRQVVVLNSGGAFGAAKLWPTPYFSSLASRLASDDRRHVLVLCGPHERALAAEIERGAAHPRVQSLADEHLSIGLSKACVRRAAAMVTTDSGPRHFAAAFGVPVVTLFGPTHIGLSENYHSQAIHLQRKLDCVPCQRRTCPLGHHRCMRDLSIDEVYNAVKQLLPSRATVQAA